MSSFVIFVNRRINHARDAESHAAETVAEDAETAQQEQRPEAELQAVEMGVVSLA
jgi:hypothetical protein